MLHHTTSNSCGWGDHCNHCSHFKKHNSNHLSVHQWIRSAICGSQQPTSPIGSLLLKLPPPLCAVLLLVNKTSLQMVRCHQDTVRIDIWLIWLTNNHGAVTDQTWTQKPCFFPRSAGSSSLASCLGTTFGWFYLPRDNLWPKLLVGCSTARDFHFMVSRDLLR